MQMAIICAVDLRLCGTWRRLAGLSPAEGVGPSICIFWTVTVVVLFLFCFFLVDFSVCFLHVDFSVCFLHVDFSVCVRPFYSEHVVSYVGFLFLLFRVVYAFIVLFQFIFSVVLSIFIVLVFSFRFCVLFFSSGLFV